MSKRGKNISRVYFRNILPETFQNKSLEYYKFGYNDNLPLDLINVINNSGAAKKSAKKFAEYITADGFSNEQAAKFKVNESETADKILSKIALSFAYFLSAVIHIQRLGNGRVGAIRLMPLHKFRRTLDGNWCYNPTIGTEKVDKGQWQKFQSFQGEQVSKEQIQKNLTEFGGRGEIYYCYDGNPFDSDIYAIPDYLSSIEDLHTSSELSKMDYESVLNGFQLGGTMTFIGVDDTEKGDDGMTDRERIDDAMTQFTGLKKNKEGLTSRFAVMTNFVETADEVPVFTGNDPKPILEASNNKRDIIERAVCKLWGVHPVLLGFSEASILGNDKAIAQASNMLKNTVNPYQRLISEMFTKFYGVQIDWTISEVKTGFIDPQLYADMTKDERRNLISLPPENVNIPTEGDLLLKKLNSLSPLLAAKVIDMIPKETLLDALGIKSVESPQNPQPNE